MSQTVILTGITGFIAKHIALELVNQGYTVRGTLRSARRADEVRSAIKPLLADNIDLDKQLTFVELDLTKDDGWVTAMEGGDVLLHTASPFPIAQPKDENELIRPAVDGTLRAMRSANAAGIKRVVLTSSMAAVMNQALDNGKSVYDHTDWTDTTQDYVSPYDKSKTLAEKAAWDFVSEQAPDMLLTTVNPGLVLGPALDEHFGSSLQIVERILKAKDPAVPNFWLPAVDVRDVAHMHVAAIAREESIGKRCLAAVEPLNFQQIAQIVAEQYPDRKIPTRMAPKWLMAILRYFDAEVKAIYPLLGVKRGADTQVSRKVLGMEFRPINEAILAAAESVLKYKAM